MKVAVSACLLGEPCRFDGKAKPCPAVLDLAASCEVVSVCGEVAGGMSTPRLPSEIVTTRRDLVVVNSEGADNTAFFLEGARAESRRAAEAGCSLAILKAKSPSCGSGVIYDGTFSGSLTEGYGVLARKLIASGVRVVDEETAAACLRATEASCPGALPALLASSAADCHVIETERLVLKPLSEEDVDDVFAYCSDPVIGFDAGWEPHETREDARFFAENVASAPHVFGVFEKGAIGDDSEAHGCQVAGAVSHGPCIGSIGLIPDPRRSNPSCLMLGYSLARAAWGRGYMTEAAKATLRYGFDELGLAMVTCTHYSFNARSRRVIEKCGFVHEGRVHACDPTIDGIMRDVESYYLEADRWRRQPV